ncbi:hypothetical protein F442_18111 [Phytophthora nicotianae P10297]|uniref:Uncharacterized protein n=1 Tax=Phytophthora nicotianae P10297 TaxID=1317064 RepID=W2YEF8_PHYNI|nr:hypothetical protein F442_18111 [Phytophthora nicotianae P10297]
MGVDVYPNSHWDMILKRAPWFHVWPSCFAGTAAQHAFQFQVVVVKVCAASGSSTCDRVVRNENEVDASSILHGRQRVRRSSVSLRVGVRVVYACQCTDTFDK